jgi:hypothetical protein
LRALRTGAHLHLGFASFGEYAERLMGYRPRWTDERLRVAQALEDLPEIAQALRDAVLCWSAVRELTRVAVPENEGTWLEVAKSRSVRQIEELVAGHLPGDAPDDHYDASLKRHVLRFEVSADTLATFREAVAKIKREAGSSLDDDAALLLVARQALAGPGDAGRASYQLALTVCTACGRAWQQGQGEPIEVSSEVAEMARCDAQEIGDMTHVGETRASQKVPPATRRFVVQRHGGRCAVPACKNALFLDVHHVTPRSEGGDHDPDKLILLCAAHHRAQHRGELVIEGRASTCFRFQHADGSRYGGAVDPRTAAVFAEAFQGLRGLGFREIEVRRALERIRAVHDRRETSTESVLREALRLLGGGRTCEGAEPS